MNNTCAHVKKIFKQRPDVPQHYGEERCGDCGKWIRWVPWPRAQVVNQITSGHIMKCFSCDGEEFVVVIGKSGRPEIVCASCGELAGYTTQKTAEKFISHNQGGQQ